MNEKALNDRLPPGWTGLSTKSDGRFLYQAKSHGQWTTTSDDPRDVIGEAWSRADDRRQGNLFDESSSLFS